MEYKIKRPTAKQSSDIVDNGLSSDEIAYALINEVSKIKTPFNTSGINEYMKLEGSKKDTRTYIPPTSEPLARFRAQLLIAADYWDVWNKELYNTYGYDDEFENGMPLNTYHKELENLFKDNDYPLTYNELYSVLEELSSWFISGEYSVERVVEYLMDNDFFKEAIESKYGVKELLKEFMDDKLNESKKITIKVKNGTDLEQLFPMSRNDVPIGPQNVRSGSGKIAAIEVNGKTFELEMTTEENDEYWNIYGGGDDGDYYDKEDASVTYDIVVKHNDSEIASDVFYYNPMVDKKTYNKLYKDIITLIKDNSGSLNESRRKTIMVESKITVYDKFL